jgi:aryl-alcohol dehydrogenase-like predicted oxidoreductase
MLKRKLGPGRDRLSVVGFGGVIVMNETPRTARNYVAKAVDLGINYFDVAPSYGNAQERLGPALKSYRASCFLACKTAQRTAREARTELERSLRQLKTDHLDLYQLHAVNTPEDMKTVLGPGGALETLVAARDAGLVRHLGFSSHSENTALTMLDAFAFDTILFPVNCVAWQTQKFGPRVLAQAARTHTAVLALKSLAQRPWEKGEDRGGFKSWYKPVDTYYRAALSLRFTLSQPVVAAVSPGDIGLLLWMCQVAEDLRPLSTAEQKKLKAYTLQQKALFQHDK